MAGRALLLVAMALGGAAAYWPGSPFVEGEVCEDVDPYAPAASILRGKHMLLGIHEWTRLGYPDASQPRGWGGVDVELLDRVSGALGFNYSLVDVGQPADNETWTDHLVREVHRVDAMLIYWVQLTKRIDHMLFMTAHQDISLALLSRPSSDEEDYWVMSLYAWSLPFGVDLWLAIVTIVVASAAVDYLLERRQATTTYLESLYEFSAGILWGGFADPKSSTSATYQVAVAFLMLLLVSSYTANLAAYITINAGPAAYRIQWMGQAVHEQRAVCSNFKAGYAGKLKLLFPRANWVDTAPYASQEDSFPMLDECDGIVVTKLDSRSLLQNSEWCQLRLVEVVSPAETAGWVTNQKSACVVKAFSWALTSLLESGQVEMLMDDYFRPATCSHSNAPTGSRRMAAAPSPGDASSESGLSLSSGAGFLAPRLREEGKPTARAHRPVAPGRRTKGVANLESQETSSDQDSKMTLTNFAGPLALWALWSLGSVAWEYLVPDAWKRLPPAPRACRRLGQPAESPPTSAPDGGHREIDPAPARSDSNSGRVRMTDIWSDTQEALSILRRLERVCADGDPRRRGGAAESLGNNGEPGSRHD